MSLLPLNATHFEKTVEQALKYNLEISVLNGFKFKTTGTNINLALSWEYSLAQVNVDDFRERVLQGLQFHRYKGTPYALRLAFSWYNFNNIKIEEEEPGEHFAEFQIGLKEIPNDLDVEKIIEVSQSAAPLRSRLARMYNDLYDVRRFILDQSDWGDLLSDYSGYRPYEGAPKFSYGRVNNYELKIPASIFNFYAKRSHWSYVVNVDRPLLDWTILDDGFVGVKNYDMSREAHRFFKNSDYIGDKLTQIFESRKQAKAGIVLSDGCTLDDINTVFSCGYEENEQETFMLSYSFLSQHPVIRTQVLVAYREYRVWNGSYALNTFTSSAIRGYNARATYGICRHNIATTRYSTQENFRFAQYKGNNSWLNQQHADIPWNEQNNFMGKIVA